MMGPFDVKEEIRRLLFIRRDLGTVEELLDTDDMHHLSGSNEGFNLLNKALTQGYPEVAMLLLRKGAYIHRPNYSPVKTPLYLAASGNYVEVVQKLLEMGASVNASDEFGQTPLHKAILAIISKQEFQNNYKILDLLLKAGADVSALDYCGGSPLLYAVKLRELKVVEMLVSYYKNIDYASPAGTSEFRGYTALHCAVQRSKSDIVTLLLERGASVNIVACYGETALHMALQKSYSPGVASELIKRGSNIVAVCTPGKLTGYRYATLHSADLCKNEYKEYTTPENKLMLIKVLLENGANVDATYRMVTPCHLAVNLNRVDELELLLKHGADPNLLNEDKKTILRIAVESGRARLVQTILKFPGLNNERNAGILLVALQNICKNSYIIVRDLLEYGFVPADKFQSSELMFIALTQHCDYTVEEMLKNGFDVNKLYTFKEEMLIGGSRDVAANNSNNTTSLWSSFMPLHLTVRLHLVSKARVLIRYGADVNAQDGYSQTPVSYLSKKQKLYSEEYFRSNKIMIELLVENGMKSTVLLELFQLVIPMQDMRYIRFLYEYQPSIVNCVDGRGDTLLQYAVMIDFYNVDFFSSDKICILKLLHMGSDINAVGSNGLTPLASAVSRLNASYAHAPLTRKLINKLMKIVIPILTRHCIKLQAAGLYVCSQNKVALGSFPDNDYYEKCKGEVLAMKNENIAGLPISYYDFLTCDQNRLARLANNTALVHGVKSKKILDKFPEYAYRLELQWDLLIRASKRASLLEVCEDVFRCCITDLPYLCLDKVLNNLGDDDLENLVHTRYPQRNFPRKRISRKWPETISLVKDLEKLLRI